MNTDTTKPELKRETATQAFHREVKELKPRLPDDWKVRFVLKYPAYNSYQGGLILAAVINQRSTDLKVLEGLKVLIAEHEAKQAAGE